jgi:threonine dehydrogenase-like Zn-dependent dehydrogenase
VKAVVFMTNKNVELQDRPMPVARRASDVLIRVIACGLCGSDLRTMTDPPQMPCNPNTVLGHEIVGEVEESGTSNFAKGDVVAVVPNYPCRTCFSCRRGLINLCDNFEHIGSHTDGGLAEFVSVPSEFLYLVPPGLDPYVAALVEPLACVLNGATRANWLPEEPVVILGGGPIGLLFLAMAKLSGASPIVVSEPNPARAKVALDIGADFVVDPSEPESLERIAELVGGHGAPTVIDALGTLLESALTLVSKGGEIFSFGVNHGAHVTISQSVIVDKEVTIHGVYIAKGTFPLALKLLNDHQDLFAKVVSHRIPLGEWERAKTLLMSGEAPGKILITTGEQ